MITTNGFQTFMRKASTRVKFAEIYGPDNSSLDYQIDRYINLFNLFQSEFPVANQVRLFSTSGRTEIAGNHTDHQHGHVLCASVDMDIIAVVSPNNENIIRLKSEGYDKADVIELNILNPIESEKLHSSALIRGIAAAFKERGHKIGGFDAYTTSCVPKGSGLSSSAAFEILVSTILNYLYNGGELNPVEMAIISQKSENLFFGKPCGLMDQCGCAAGGVMAIDFKDPKLPVLESLNVDFEKYGYSLVITNTGGSHANLTDDYALITQEMKSVAEYFGKKYLREVKYDDFITSLSGLRKKVSDRSILRAIHYFNDDKRVALQADALKKGNIDYFLELVNESGLSSWTYLQNVYSVNDYANQSVSLAIAITKEFLVGKGAVRVHGGGFAGTIQAFVPINVADEYISLMNEIFGENNSWKIRIRNIPTTEII